MRPAGTRARAAATCCVAALIVCAGCTSSSARPSAPGSGAGTAAARSAATVAASPAPPPLPSRALTSPGCATTTSKSPALTSVRTAMVGIKGVLADTRAAMAGIKAMPFGVAVTPDGHWAFVAAGASIEVLHVGAALAPVPVRNIPVAPANPLGETITSDGRYLLAADGTGAVVISVARAEQGTANAVLGTLQAPASAAGAGGAIEVAVSPDGGYAFVTLEDADRAVVFNLAKALAHGFGPADYVGSIPLGLAPVGITVSPDGRWLYATSEGGGHGPDTGTLTVADLARAETDPATSVVATVDAGCEPVRVITSADGTQVWVTARASDDLLCFAAARLTSDPARALVAIVRVGEAPVGLAAARGGSLIVVADSNRFDVTGQSANLDVVNVAAALAGRPAVIGHIRSGLFPRDMTADPDGTVLVSNYGSGELEAVDVASIPAG